MTRRNTSAFFTGWAAVGADGSLRRILVPRPVPCRRRLDPLAKSLTVPSTEFAPQAEGMEDNGRVYFAVMATLDTGEEYALSGSLAWRVSNKGPAPPARGQILHKQKAAFGKPRGIASSVDGPRWDPGKFISDLFPVTLPR
jgi:hypothetical protein